MVFAQPGEGKRPAQAKADGETGGTAVHPIGAPRGSNSFAAQRSRPETNSEDGEARLSAELKQMRRQMDQIMRAISPGPARESESHAQVSAPEQARQRLLEIGLDDEVATEVAEAASISLQGVPQGHDWKPFDDDKLGSYDSTPIRSAAIERALKIELAARLPQGPVMRERGATAGIIAFIGPPGAGKTSALAKLAFRISATRMRPVHLISADSCRIGASEQLRTFASILGSSIDFADSPKLVAQAIEANQHKELILIDTPGLSGSDFELLDDLADYLGRQAGIEKHLVLPATMRSKDLGRCLCQYEKFNADRLLFTRLDETDCFGPLYCTAVRSAVPLSFLSAGQQIPEDLEEATQKKVLELLLGAGDEKAAGCAEE